MQVFSVEERKKIPTKIERRYEDVVSFCMTRRKNIR